MRRRLCNAFLIGLLFPLAGGSAAFAGRYDGADYSWYRPSAVQLNNLGFVARYIVPRSWGSGKALTASEAASLRARGITVLLNYEWSVDGALGGYAAGQRDARYAETARAEVGAPGNLPIYFSADWDVQSYQTAAVLDYLNGAASIIGKNRVGLYGGYRAINASFNNGYRYGWQTYAWSAGKWDSRAQVRQTRNGALWGGQGDINVAVSLDFGGWGGLLSGPVSTDVVVGREPVPTKLPPADVNVYTVQRGDTLSAIAQRYGTTAAALAAVNGIRNPSLIYAGQRINVKAAAVAVPAVAPSSSATYTVRAGDTLTAIAQRYGTTAAALAARNGITNPNRIYVGQRLTVSGSPATVVYYVVARGDTLSSIAARYGTTVAALLRTNAIANPNRIYVGQRLRVR